MSSKTTAQTASLAPQLIAGIKKHFSTTSSLAFGGATYTPAQLETSLQTLIDLRAAVAVADTTAKAKVIAQRTQAPPLRSQMAAFVVFVKATYGNAPDVLADFGLTPKKVATPLTVPEKAAAAAKRAATRAARHTMGKVQKEAIKGTVTTIVTQPSPTTAPPPTVPTTAPPATPPAPVTPHPTTQT